MLVSLNKAEITQLCHILVAAECKDRESLECASEAFRAFNIKTLDTPEPPESGFGVFQSLTNTGLPLTLVLVGDEHSGPWESLISENLSDGCITWLRQVCDDYLARGVKCGNALAFSGLLKALSETPSSQETKEDTDG